MTEFDSDYELFITEIKEYMINNNLSKIERIIVSDPEQPITEIFNNKYFNMLEVVLKIILFEIVDSGEETDNIIVVCIFNNRSRKAFIF